MEAQFNHCPVMKTESIEYLRIKPEGVYCDLTLGGGSHSLEIAKRLRGGKLIAVDRDSDAIAFSREKLKAHEDKIYFVNDNFVNIENIAKKLGYEKIDGALMDLGISSFQIDSDRGFSYMKDSPLKMTMEKDQELTAAVAVNTFDKNKLKEILYNNGDERYAGLIADAIIKERAKKPIETTLELSGIIKNALRNVRYGSGHPAKKSFQAIRIFVNDEINIIKPSLDSVEQMLESGGRLAVIAFHGGEDSAVKKCFGYYEKDCVCPPDFPVCICEKRATSKIVTKKPVYPGEEEIKTNPRSQSARLRVLEKL